MYIHRLVSPFFCYVCDVTFLVEITVSLSQFWIGKWAFFVAFQSTKKGGLLKRGGEGPIPFHSKTGKQLSSPDDMGCPGFSSCCFTEIDVPIDLRWVSQGISGLL